MQQLSSFMELCMYVTRYLLGCGLLCAVHLYELHHKARAAAALGLHWSNTMVMFYEVLLRLHYGYILVIFWPLLGLQHQHGERVCYGCHGSQERINLSAIPSAPRIFFQPLISHLAYPGFSKQCRECEQRDNWHHQQNQQYNHLPKFPSLHSLVAQN